MKRRKSRPSSVTRARLRSALTHLPADTQPDRPDERAWHAMVAEAAYYRAMARGFAPGHELDDWTLAEQELAAPGAGSPRARRARADALCFEGGERGLQHSK